MWYEIFVLSWLGFWTAVAFGLDIAEMRFFYFKDALVFGTPIILATIIHLI